MQRSILVFEESIKSPTTRLNYKSNLERFLKFAKIRDYDALLSMSEDDLQELVENYVIDLKGNVNPNSAGALYQKCQENSMASLPPETVISTKRGTSRMKAKDYPKVESNLPNWGFITTARGTATRRI